jgi:ribosomal protein RSM22 (predicted rRNA methylase)
MTGLPARFADLIEAIVAEHDDDLPGEVERLSGAYRTQARPRAARSKAAVAAYLAYRAPATFAAAASVFRHVERQRDWRPRSLLDIGAGPGAATWAALERWPSLSELTLVEVEPAMLAAGRALLPEGRWIEGDVSSARDPADLVVASYVLGELGDVAGAALQLWELSADTVVFVEPGTPDGYRRVLAARAVVIEAGGHTVAPCPHDLPCPLPAGDWCHFAARLPRSKLHRRAKGVELGYEDEKFSYAVLSREPVPPAAARIIRQPQIRSGHVHLVTSERDGVVRSRTVSRKHGTVYKDAKGATWGDAFAAAD